MASFGFGCLLKCLLVLSLSNINIYAKASEESAEVEPRFLDVSNHKNLNLLPKECGLSNLKIFGGPLAFLSEYPWMALLSYQSKRGPTFRCAGTILNENYILTAAHCITQLSSPLLGVRVGEHDISKKLDCEPPTGDYKICAEPVQDVEIEEIIPHPQYSNKNFSDDIGLLRVKKLNLTRENAKPVCLPIYEESKNTVLKTGVVAGWNLANAGDQSNILQKAKQPIVNLNTCQQNYASNTNSRSVKLTYKQICAGGEQTDLCVGNGGGPLQAMAFPDQVPRWIQYGIESFGHRICSLDKFPVVYTNLLYYVDWILDNIKA